MILLTIRIRLALLARYQSGYSTTTALTKVVQDIYGGFGNNHCTVMVLVNFSLVFSCVNHRILVAKLRDDFHFSQAACNLILFFLERRKQIVRLGEVKSKKERDASGGTPQGSCLSALLFSLYINSLPNSLRCYYHLCADDLPMDNIDLDAIASWAERNQLIP